MGSSKEQKVLEILSNTPELIKILDEELSMPNIPMPTMGGHVFWTVLAQANGWTMQQNMFTHHARILDANNVRVAWGTVNGMYRAFDRLLEASVKYKDHNSSGATALESMEQLKKLKELLDLGIITEAEYSEKKQKLLQNI